MDPTDSVADLVERVRNGDPQAAELLFVRYAQRLVLLADRHLSRCLAGRLEGEDVVQSVFRTFFRRTAEGQFRIGNGVQLWRLLVKITLLKVRAKARQHTASMRDAAAELSEGSEAWLAEALAAEPGPAEAAALVDQIESLLKGLPPLYRRLLELRLAGENVADVARQLKVSRQTVYRALNVLQKRLLRTDLGTGPK